MVALKTTVYRKEGHNNNNTKLMWEREEGRERGKEILRHTNHKVPLENSHQFVGTEISPSGEKRN